MHSNSWTLTSIFLHKHHIQLNHLQHDHTRSGITSPSEMTHDMAGMNTISHHMTRQSGLLHNGIMTIGNMNHGGNKMIGTIHGVTSHGRTTSPKTSPSCYTCAKSVYEKVAKGIFQIISS